MTNLQFFPNMGRSWLLLFSLLGIGQAQEGQPAIPNLPCIDQATGRLQEGKFVENGECVDSSSWYYGLVPAPITSNGLHMGAPSHFHLWFGSIGKPVEDAFDPENYGLYIEGIPGRLVLELSPHFVYDTRNNLVPVPLVTTEMATSPANIIYPSPCSEDIHSKAGQIFCGGWFSQFANTGTDIPIDVNQIEIVAPDGLSGIRARDIGIKFVHIHPELTANVTNNAIYNNANGTCSTTGGNQDGDVTEVKSGTTNGTIYCLFDSDCPTNNTCVASAEPFNAYVTASLYNRQNELVHKGTNYYTFDVDPRYFVHTVNTGIANSQEAVMMADFQRVRPGAKLTNVTLGEDGLYITSAPYAPRFFMFGPKDFTMAFPSPGVDDITVELTSETTATIYSANEEVGQIELIQPAADAGGKILDEEALGYIRDGPARFGGTLIGVPLQVGTALGKYIVRVTVNGGSIAETRIIVTEQEQEDVTNDDSAANLLAHRYISMSISFVALFLYSWM